MEMVINISAVAALVVFLVVSFVAIAKVLK